MSDQTTVAELFDMAINAERLAGRVYRRFAESFSHHTALASFWRSYAQDEDSHAQELESLRTSLTVEQLHEPADVSMVEVARTLLEFSIEDAMMGIRDLEAAYKLAERLEESETNMLFEFLLTNFAIVQRAKFFVRARIQEHVARLKTDLPDEYNSKLKRMSIKVNA